MDIEEETSAAISGALRVKINREPNPGMVEHIAAALMPLVKRAQAEAWDEAVESASLEETLYRTYIYHGDNPYIEKEAGE